ncbi:MAG TPA: DoxX family protein [Thermoanaerobaculia bacterium]|nr:DoxX family protein [Thermoanaerobaculia bacterium]
MSRLFAALERRKDIATFLLRLLLGARLVWGAQDNVFSWERMEEFARFLGTNGFPWPLPGAVLSACVQFVCGLLLMLGAFTRWASLLIVLNFIAALLIAHRADTFEGMFPALVMLFGGLFFLFHGAGRPSVDAATGSRR